MKRDIDGLILGCFLLLPGLALASDWTGNASLFLGSKVLDDSDWYAYQHSEAGVLVDFAQRGWPVNMAVDVLGSSGDDTSWAYIPGYGTTLYKEEVQTRELNLGVRKIWDVAPIMHPYFGGGLAYVTLDAKGSASGLGTIKDDGDGIGIWLDGGIYWTIEAFNIGFDIRYSQATVSLDAGDFEGGGGHAGMLVGYHW